MVWGRSVRMVEVGKQHYSLRIVHSFGTYFSLAEAIGNILIILLFLFFFFNNDFYMIFFPIFAAILNEIAKEKIKKHITF